MKLIDELAKEFCDNCRLESSDPKVQSFLHKIAFEGFKAGFKKSRERCHARFEQAFERGEVVQDTLDSIACLGENEIAPLERSLSLIEGEKK